MQRVSTHTFSSYSLDALHYNPAISLDASETQSEAFTEASYYIPAGSTVIILNFNKNIYIYRNKAHPMRFNPSMSFSKR